jgi:TPR repeat protein
MTRFIAAIVAAATWTTTAMALDDIEVFEIMRPLAEEGDPTAQVNIGTTYYFGLGVAEDYDEAAKWFQLAAEQGNPMGQSFLGQLYFWGHGVPKDYVLSYMWFSLAVAQGDEDSKVGQDAAASQMTPDQLAEAQRLAREWRPTPHQ